MSLYHDYRPDSLEKMKGNKDTITALTKMLENLKKCPHSFLLTGPTGCGKTTLARIIANKLECKGVDFREINTADFRGIDSARDIIKKSQYMPVQSKCTVWLIDECHKLTKDAQNALLKILEDTPSHVYFILCTTDPQLLISTIKGRCSVFQMELLDESQMFKLLKSITKAEGEKVETEIYDQIIQDSGGHVRDAIQILEQVLNVPAEKRLTIAKQAAENQAQILELCQALVYNKGWNKIKMILKGLKGQDPESIRRAVLAYTTNTLLNKDDGKLGLILEEFLEPTYNSGFSQIVYACYSITKG